MLCLHSEYHQLVDRTHTSHYPAHNDLRGLDSGYPYPFDATYTADTTSHKGQDQPFVYLNRYPTEDDASAADAMTMYIMYLPPGTGSNAVPLRCVSYTWGGEATKSGSTWSLAPVAPSLGSATATSEHPTWNLLHTNND